MWYPVAGSYLEVNLRVNFVISDCVGFKINLLSFYKIVFSRRIWEQNSFKYTRKSAIVSP